MYGFIAKCMIFRFSNAAKPQQSSLVFVFRFALRSRKVDRAVRDFCWKLLVAVAGFYWAYMACMHARHTNTKIVRTSRVPVRVPVPTNAACGTGTHTGTQDSNAYRCGKQSILGASLEFRKQNTSPERAAERKVRRFFPRLSSLVASRRCSRFSLPFVLRSRRRFHHPGRGRLRAHRPSPPAWPPPRPRKRGAKTTRIFTEYFPETTRRAPPEYFSNTARRPPENPREYLANTSRAPSGSLRVCMRFL